MLLVHKRTLCEHRHIYVDRKIINSNNNSIALSYNGVYMIDGQVILQ